MKLSKPEREQMRAKRNSRGLTLIELMFVLVIIIILVAIAVPPITNFMAGFRIRSASAAMETLVQETRMRSVRDDTIYSMAQIAWPTGSTGFCVVNPATMATPGGPAVPGDCLTQPAEQTIVMPTNVQVSAEANAPAVVPTSTPYTQLATTPLVLVTFNARGLPCLYAAGVCSTLPAGSQVGYVTYFVTTPPRGSAIYRAVTVTPAGRVRIWANQAGVWQ